MKKVFALLAAWLLVSACSNPALKPGEPVYVTITSTLGDVTVKLYDDTPLHRDNFIKLCQENAYEGVLFHRIIKDFVVQGGDPTSVAHEPGCYMVMATEVIQYLPRFSLTISTKEEH